MVDIDKVKGVIVEPNGTTHSFGHCLMIPKEIETTHEKHEKCFEEEIIASDWWKNSNLSYDYNHYYYEYYFYLLNKYFSFLLNQELFLAYNLLELILFFQLYNHSYLLLPL